MSEIIVRREHTLGLDSARRIARIWTNNVTQKLDISCKNIAGEKSDRVEFSRAGVKGYMEVAADYIEIRATLGVLFSPFAKQAQEELGRRLEGSIAYERNRPASGS
jgi:putative polyhydroxyalkanoate system protein